ncbi:hypothetical protein NQZ71_22930 (plasmid) [Niallia taxi]|uniref:hypothetical protein n=1 Tax=Niallia taxi TaxID=2499688 RepID=UPI0023A98E54|nr:hypothetical protein [Niallia taxi]MDE5054483.1 hypothetical protein [Niallia taxi]WOD64788.1 hypothetical protein NQZ71_22930 [Niallia taxi]
MKKGREPILHTNVVSIILFCFFFSLLTGAVTENLKIFIGTMLTVPIISFLVFILWLKLGHSGILLNSVNVFIMLTMMSVYFSIPLFSIIWGHWTVWFTIFIHLATFVVGFIKREFLALRLNGIKDSKRKEPSRFLLYYFVSIFAVGTAGFIILQVSLATSASGLSLFTFLHFFAYMFFAISPAFLVRSERALELGIISQRHYDEYN